jgi:hypothetical protein
MVKKNLILSTMAMLSMYHIQAQFPSCNTPGEDFKAFFVDGVNATLKNCLIIGGAMIVDPVAAVCQVTKFSNFETSLDFNNSVSSGNVTSTAKIPGLSPDQTIGYCDIYEAGVGYLNSVADSGISVVFLDDRFGDAMDLHYRSLANPAANFTWDWQEFASLAKAYAAKTQCTGSNTTAGSGSFQGILGGDVWPDLAIDWAFWRSNAQTN